VLDVIRMVMMK